MNKIKELYQLPSQPLFPNPQLQSTRAYRKYENKCLTCTDYENILRTCWESGVSLPVLRKRAPSIVPTVPKLQQEPQTLWSRK